MPLAGPLVSQDSFNLPVLLGMGEGVDCLCGMGEDDWVKSKDGGGAFLCYTLALYVLQRRSSRAKEESRL